MATNNGTSTASGVVFSSLSHAGKTQTVALFPGLSIDELTSLLKTIFGISSQQSIVGINAERGLVIPLSLVCRTPTVIPNSVCKLLVSPLASRDGTVVDNQDNVEKLAAAETPEKMTDADSTEFVMQEILKFIDSLYRQKFLDSIQRRALADLLLENSTLLFAAYSVAVSANDSEYLAEICKDLAISMATEQGKLACEAQDEVLQVCDQLYLNEKITENQLLYLRHLVLIREEPVAALYDDFQEHQSVPLLAKSLYELAFTHPYQNHSDAAKSEATKPASTNEEEEEDDDEDDVDDDEDLYEREKLAQKTQLQLKKRTSAGDEKSAAAKKETEQSSKESAIQGLTGALTLMIRTKFITEEEALVLYEMIRNQNEYVMAAYELYCYDNKLDELQDTLLRVAKLEIRKKIASSREMALNAAQKSMLYDEKDEKEDDDEEDEDEGDDVDNNDEDEDEDDAKYSDDYDEEPIELESIRLESLLEALDVHNIWSKTVPDKFIQAVFVAAVRSQLSIAQARALCDLFHANYDLVHAAWEVYTVQKDKDDFIDSLARIVRDLDFDEDGVIPELKPSTAASAPSSEATKKNVATSTQAAAPTKTAAPAPSTAKPAATAAPAPSVPKANTAASTKKGESPSKESSGPSSQQEAQRNEIIDRKKEAIAAVAAAKKDLLKHSLDMMVKQNLTSAVSADRLIERYSQGDALVDAAIEAYAADRDVNEFLDTLHILANHSKEELEDMMRQSDADGDSQSNSKPNSTTLSVPEAVLEQIVGIVEEMRKNDMISTVAEEILRGLIRKQDSRVISAFKVYVQVKDGADLIDSLLRIAAYEVAQRNIQSQQPKQGPSSSASASAQEEEEEEEEEEDQEMQEGGDNSDSIGANADGTVLSAGDQKTVVQILLRANAVDEPQAAYLNELIDLGDVQVRKVFYEYEQDKNVYKLIAALKAYNKPAVSRDDNSESYEDDFEEDADEDDRAAVEDRFFSIIKAMSLSHLETAALRLAIARDDEEIRKVITQFKADRNEEVLKRQLRALAVKTINETIDDDDDDEEEEEEENGKAADADQDDEDDEEDDDDADDDAGYGNHESKGKFDFSYSQQRPASSPGNSAMNFQGYWGRSAASAFGPASTFRALDQKNSDDDDDNDEDEDDDDEAEEDEEDADGNEDEQADDDDDDDDDELPTGRSTLTSQTARQHVFPILVAELVRENIIGKKEGSSIMDQFNSGNPVVSAALDVYDRNNNMAQLVDTLQQMDDDKDAHDDVEKGSKGKGADHGEDFDADLQVSSSAFEALERDFQEVLADLMVDESLEKFRLEYEKLHRALKKSHEQEKRLVKKCRELNSEILNNQAKIKTALRLSQEDQKTITHLQKEMEKTWKLVYMSQEKEARAKETIGQLKEEMINLSKLVERGAGLSMSQETIVKELKQAKEELQLIVDEQAAKLQLTENQLMTQNKVQEELRDERDESNRQVAELRERLQARENDNARESKRREKTQKELQDVRSKFDEEMRIEEQIRGELSKSKQHAADLDKQLADAKATIEKCLKDYDTLLAKTQKVTDDLESQVKQNKKMLESQQAMEKDLGLKRIEVSRLNTDNGLLQKKLDKEHRSAQHYQQMAEDAKTPLSVAQAEIESLKKELLVAHRHELQLNREAEKTLHEKEVQQKMASRMEAKAKEASDLVTEKKRSMENLEAEIDVFKQEVGELKKAIYQLERDRERLGNEVSEQRNNVFNASEEIKLKDIQISEFKKRITEWENKLKQQQQLYETVRADRNHYSKGLLESQDEIAELKKKFKIMGHQIEQLKEEIVAKDQAIVKEHFEFQRSEKLKENVMSELNRKNLMIQSNHDLIHQQENELRNLSSALRRMDEEALAQRKEYDQVINERDILGTQLIRRNDELALLYEKLRIQDSALTRGEVQYMSRMDDIRVMRVKLKELVREHAIAKSIGPQVDELKREVLQLQKELLQEKTKVTALSEELENPMNVHRWRKLEGSDPATFELIQKIQTLQRRLIAKTEEVVEKGLVIQEKEKLYNELKAILARQPGPEVAEQLTVYQQNLKKKNVQMKAMASELNMYQAQVNESKYEQERLSRELTEMKRKYYLQKRKEKIVEDMEYEAGGNVSMSKSGPISIHQEQTAAAKNARIRYTGGGYAIN